MAAGHKKLAYGGGELSYSEIHSYGLPYQEEMLDTMIQKTRISLDSNKKPSPNQLYQRDV